MPRPDYHNSIVNLAAALGVARGGTGFSVPPLDTALAGPLDRRHLVLFIIDGLGDQWLSRVLGQGFLARHRIGRLTSVFPTTTASAITSLYTATPPCEHGITGWFTWLRELGSVATVLPFEPRIGGTSYTESGVQPADIIGASSLFDRVDSECHVITPHYITDSAYSRATAGGARRHGYRTLDEMFALTTSVLRESLAERTLTYVYWTELDAIGHARGIDSPDALSSLERLDLAMERFVDRFVGEDVALLLTADHGMVDAGPDQRIDLTDHPKLRDLLSLPLCGEPRMAYCYLHGRAEQPFLEYVNTHLSQAGDLYETGRALDDGLFGDGPWHTELHHRTGDYLFLTKDHYTVSEHLAGEKPFRPVGVHGGLHPDELYVPLIRFNV